MIAFIVDGISLDLPEKPRIQVRKPNSVFKSEGIGVAYSISSLIPYSPTNDRVFGHLKRRSSVIEKASFPCVYTTDGKQSGFGTLHVLQCSASGYKVSLSMSDFIAKSFDVSMTEISDETVLLGGEWPDIQSYIQARNSIMATESENYYLSKGAVFYPMIYAPDFYDGLNPTYFDGFFNNLKFNQGGESSVMPQVLLAWAMKTSLDYIGFSLEGDVYSLVDKANWFILQNFDPRRGISDDTVIVGVPNEQTLIGKFRDKIPLTTDGAENGRDDNLIFNNNEHFYVAPEDGTYEVSLSTDVRFIGDGQNNLSDEIIIALRRIGPGTGGNEVAVHNQVVPVPNNSNSWISVQFTVTANNITEGDYLYIDVWGIVNEGLFQDDLEDVYVKNSLATFTNLQGETGVTFKVTDLLPKMPIGQFFAAICKAYNWSFDLDPVTRTLKINQIDIHGSEQILDLSSKTGEFKERKIREQTWSLADNVLGDWPDRPQVFKTVQRRIDIGDNSGDKGKFFKVEAEDAIYVQYDEDGNTEYVTPETLPSNTNASAQEIAQPVKRPAMISHWLTHDNGAVGNVIMPFFSEKGRWQNQADGQNPRLPLTIAFGHYGVMGNTTKGDYFTLMTSILGSVDFDYDSDPAYQNIKSIIDRQKFDLTTNGVFQNCFWPLYQYMNQMVEDTYYSLLSESEIASLELHKPMLLNHVKYLIMEMVYDYENQGVSPTKSKLLRLVK